MLFLCRVCVCLHAVFCLMCWCVVELFCCGFGVLMRYRVVILCCCEDAAVDRSLHSSVVAALALLSLLSSSWFSEELSLTLQYCLHIFSSLQPRGILYSCINCGVLLLPLRLQMMSPFCVFLPIFLHFLFKRMLYYISGALRALDPLPSVPCAARDAAHAEAPPRLAHDFEDHGGFRRRLIRHR